MGCTEGGNGLNESTKSWEGTSLFLSSWIVLWDGTAWVRRTGGRRKWLCLGGFLCRRLSNTTVCSMYCILFNILQYLILLFVVIWEGFKFYWVMLVSGAVKCAPCPSLSLKGLCSRSCNHLLRNVLGNFACTLEDVICRHWHTSASHSNLLQVAVWSQKF